MAINLPLDQTEVVDRVKTDVQSELPVAQPFLPNSYVGALCTGFGGRVFDNYEQLQEILKQMFPDTATGVYAERWGAFVNVFKNAAHVADGRLVVIGTVNLTVLPVNSVFTSVNGQSYLTTSEVAVSDISISLSSLTRVASTVNAVSVSAHNLATGMNIIISGATPSDYNGTYKITVNSATTFSYQITTTPVTTATGTILATYKGANVGIISEGTGLITNQDSGASLTLTNTISGINSTAFVPFAGITHGSDIEDEDIFKSRYLYRYRNIHAEFNVASIVSKAKEVPGVTRVWVREITPEVGDVTINFTRDNDLENVPDATAVSDVRTKILSIKPAFADDSQVHVSAPNPIPVQFTFSALNPNTTEMHQAIKANLDFFFRDAVNVGETIVADAYRAVIYQTTDSTGAAMASFTLSSPSAGIPIAAGEIGTYDPDTTIFPS